MDAGLLALLGYLGFRLALLVAPCKDQSSCPLLTPLVVGFVILAALIYLVPGYLAWKTTPAQHLFGVE